MPNLTLVLNLKIFSFVLIDRNIIELIQGSVVFISEHYDLCRFDWFLRIAANFILAKCMVRSNFCWLDDGHDCCMDCEFRY